MLIRPKFTYNGKEYPSIGGSDMYHLRDEKRRNEFLNMQQGLTKPEDLSSNFAVQAGSYMESFMRDWLRKIKPEVHIQDPLDEPEIDTLPHPTLQRKTRHTNVDGWINYCPIEIKFSMQTNLTGDEYIASKEPQCQHHMDITNSDQCLLVYALSDMKFNYITINRDDKFIEEQRKLTWDYQEALVNSTTVDNLKVPDIIDNQSRKVLDLNNSEVNFASELRDLFNIKFSLIDATKTESSVTKEIKKLIEPHIYRKVLSDEGTLKIDQNKNGNFIYRFSKHKETTNEV
tara:strand:- start:3747 stop:4607 length:861 start_codon:yes stop_codon:yes gene_type:complete